MTSASLRLLMLSTAALGLAACSKPASESTTPAGTSKEAAAALESVEQRASYGIGFDVGRNIGSQPGMTIDQTAFAAGLADALAKQEPRLSMEDIQAAFTTMQERSTQATASLAEANLKTANEFLEANKAKPGVQTTASGLQYEVITRGTGEKPKAENTVEVHYHGTLVDGTVFDSSVDRGETIEFPVTRVIPGWVEALQLMSVGDKWRLFIPPGLGYGPRAAGKIPPNSALIFEVELIGIK